MSSLVLHILATGGLVLWPIALCSMAVLTVIIERLWRLLPMRRRFEQVRADLHETLLHGGAAAALEQLDAEDPLSRVLRSGLSVRDRGPDTVRAVALDAAQKEVPAIERGLGVLIGTTQVAPLLGLLGTVVGLIEAFRAVSEGAGIGGTTGPAGAALAKGIYQALGATAAGLLVAIPAFLAYNGLSVLCGRLVDQLEHAATDLPLLLREPPARREERG